MSINTSGKLIPDTQTQIRVDGELSPIASLKDIKKLQGSYDIIVDSGGEDTVWIDHITKFISNPEVEVLEVLAGTAPDTITPGKISSQLSWASPGANKVKVRVKGKPNIRREWQ